MSANLPPTIPIFNGIDYNPLFYTENNDGLTYEQASKNFLKYPNAQGTETLQSINVNGTATFSVQPLNTATQPATNDNTTKIPNTSWVQSVISTIPQTSPNNYLYPQKWLSSLYKNAGTIIQNPPTYPSQTIDIILPLPNNVPTTGTGPWYGFVRVLCQTSIYGVYQFVSPNALMGNIFSCSSELNIQVNLRVPSSTIVTAQSNSVSNTLNTSTLGNMISNSTNIPVNNNATNTSTTVSFTPITVTYAPSGLTNVVRLTWNQFSATAGIQQSIFGITRSAEILSCSLNTWSNSTNFNSWNQITYPNQNTTLTTNAGSGTQNLAAYIQPVSTNNY